MYDRYVELRDIAGVKDAEVAKNIGIAQSTFTDWKKGRSAPKTEKLAKIAGFFGVSVDYFTESAEAHKPPQETLSAQERELIEIFRRLNDIGRIDALETISNMLYVPKYTQKKEASSHSA